MLKEKYNPSKFGAVTAIRLYFLDDGVNPMADLAFAFGGMHTICWVDVAQREEFLPGINGYTYIFDERPAVSGSFVRIDRGRLERFRSFIKKPESSNMECFDDNTKSLEKYYS